MTEPNYQYCACFCPGKIMNCPHYEPKDEKFSVCKTYVLIGSVAPNHKWDLSKESLDKMVEDIRKNGG